MKKQTGIWIDLRNAWVINLPIEHDGEIVIEHIISEIEEGEAVGGTRSRTPWGPQHGNDQSKLEERRHHEEKHFFTNILKHIHPTTEELVIFGPSEAKYGLDNLIAKQHAAPKIMGVEAADKMTEHQMTAWVRNYFGRPAPRLKASFGQIHE